MKEPYEMTLIQYTAYLLNQNKYRQSYKKSAKAMESFKAEAERKWIEVLLARAEVEKLDNVVINDFVKRYGTECLFRTFRGIYENGIKGWIPSVVRSAKAYQVA